MAEDAKAMGVNSTAVNILHDRQQEDVVAKTPHSFGADNIKGV